MEGVVARLEHLEDQIKLLGLREYEGSVDAQRKPRLHMSPLFQNRDFGREEDKLAFTNLLLSGDIVSSGTPDVISVSGMPGIGKTTLVQVVYDDESMTGHFDFKVWIYVGQDFDVFRVTKEVLHKITSGTVNTEDDLSSLQFQLMETLAKKRFLLVLDDFWSESSSEWNLFLTAFTGGSEGSKIVLTTQSDVVTSITKAARTYQLRLMTDTECWELICCSVFGYKSRKSIDHELERVGKRIAEQCKGLPLAATTIASHLRSKPDDLQAWYDVSRNFLYYTTGVLEVLQRSYDSLPCHLKRCFAFCSLFPKGHEFDRKDLVLLWMAVDLLYQPGSYEELEDIGNKYLDDLVARSFLQSLGYKDKFTMHDLMNDLAKTAAGDFCFRLEDDNMGQIPERVRHLSFCGKQWDSSVASTFTRGAEYLRTFLTPPRFGSSELAEKALDPLPNFSEQSLSCLRILSLSHYRITKLPDSFRNVKQLRYLDLSNTDVKQIPEFVFTRNLQTLFLSNCRRLRYLTYTLINAISLRYLFLLRTPLVEMPQGIIYLSRLQRLSNFVIGEMMSGARLQELGDLHELRGTLHISELQNVVSLTEASGAGLRKKPFLKKLVLTWSMETSGSKKIACEQSELLKKLQPHPNLEKVSINSYWGATFPSWLGDTSFINMTSVSLTSCSLCILLPPLGQLPKLKYLSIEKFKILKKVGLEFFYGENDSQTPLEPFPNLESLSFYDMPRWEDWNCPELEGGIFPRLKKITIRSCPSLKKYPKGIPEITQVTISDCDLRCEEDYGKVSEPSLSEKEELHGDIAVATEPYQNNLLYNVDRLSIDAGSSSRKMIPQQDEDDKSSESSQDDTSFESIKVTKVPELEKLSESLSRLHIEGCPGLEFLPESLLQDCPNLEELLLVDCQSLEAFPGGYPSTTLKTLYIRDCVKMVFIESLQPMLIFPRLEDLFIGSSCSTLSSFPLALFLNLKSLSIRDCKQLSSFTTVLDRSDVRLALEALEITDCPKLEFFPEGGLRTLKLSSILISNYRNLRRLPAKLNTLTSLLSIHLNECPEFERLPLGQFPESLQTLCISRCQKLRPTCSWLMRYLGNLRNFEMEEGNDDTESFPEESLLPRSLYTLRISGFKNLRTLNYKGLEGLATLGILEISGCDKLASLPDEGLPSSLSLLRINGCPILKEKISRKDMEWFKIKHIQLVEIDGEQLLRGRKKTEYLS
ncbi:putative disease resistance protein At3g14460 [Eutrema salsugineum]|uniref:putative disease resistance protein At3g14460 n=1 Tax=Eutrema salsugineum TaxID=72664 RepID=UPI000CECEBD4|nr:putative disease resistance protein At3g14460 [Eutrema salsugineum]